MIKEIIMPKMSTSMKDGRLAKWYKKEGDTIEKGELLMEVETDKASMEVESFDAGIIKKLLIEENDVAEVAVVIGYIGDENDQVPEAANKAQEAKKEDDSEGKETSTVEKSKTSKVEGVKITPKARKFAKEQKVDLALVTPTNGKIGEKEVEEYLKSSKSSATPLVRKIAENQGISIDEVSGTGVGGKITKSDLSINYDADDDDYKVVPLKGIRKVIASRMIQSKLTAPHVSFFMDIDMTKCIEFRKKANETYGSGDLKLSYLNILTGAVTKTILEYQDFNAGIFDDEIRYFDSVNIGIAVDSPNGLVVPVVRGTHKMTLKELSKQSKEMVNKALDGSLTPDEMTGGTFTISSLSGLGIDSFTAIINPPESAILSVSRTQDKPVVKNGEIVVAPIMNLTLTVDHRLIDGAMATKFLTKVKSYIEEPALLSL